MPKEPNVIELEINGPTNESHRFRPLQRTLRGRFDLNRVADRKGAADAMVTWPDPIPGMRLSINVEARTATLVDPIHDDQKIRDRIAKAGMELAPASEKFAAIDLDTWIYWARAAVNAGHAQLLRGEFPAIDESKVQRSFIRPKQPTLTDRLAAAMERQTDVFAALLAKLSPAK